MSDRSISAGPVGPTAFAPDAREDFLEAIARHRRSAWRVTAACAVAYAVLGLVVAELMAPLLYSVVGLALDVVNLVVPAPDLLGYAGRVIGQMVYTGDPVALDRIVGATALAALPGLALFALAVFALRRALMQSPMFDGGLASHTLGRQADPTRLAEIQIADTVEEMAIAAMIPAPRVVFVDGSSNGASFGVDIGHATVMIGAAMPESLTRSQMQAVAAHLVAAIANGDMTIGMRTALTLGVFSLFAKLAVGWNDGASRESTRRLLRALIAPTPANLSLILAVLSDPFANSAKTTPVEKQVTTLTWREWAQMPFMGPIFMSGFLAGVVNTMLLAPLLCVAWRQRKYTADATAVQLTRDPDALDSALIAIADAGASTSLAVWAGHLCIVDPGTNRNAGLIGNQIVSIFPSMVRRHRALVRMGATDRLVPVAGRAMPLWALPVLVVLGVVLAALFGTLIYLLVVVSAMLACLFTILPTFILHHVLR